MNITYYESRELLPRPFNTMPLYVLNMGFHDWKLDRNRPISQYGLSDKQREFIITGNTGSYNRSQLERDISTKSEKQMDRIQDLLDDIYLLCYGDYLSESDEVIRDQLTDLDFPSGSPIEEEISRSDIHSSDPVANLSFELGFLFQMTGLEERRPDEIIWSFLLGLVGSPSGNFQQESERINNLIEQIESLHTRRVVREGTLDIAGEQDDIRELYKITKTVLRDANVSLSVPLVSAIVQYQLYPNDSGLDIDIPSSSEMESLDWQGEGGPEKDADIMNVRDWDEENIHTTVQRLLSETPLRKVEHLKDDLKVDKEQILTREKFGAQADEIFRSLPSDGTRIERDSIRGQIDASLEMLTAVLNRLSAKPDYPLWTSRPVVEEPAEAVWCLTKYGQLLYETMCSEHGNSSWVHYSIADPSMLSTRNSNLLTDVLSDSDA